MVNSELLKWIINNLLTESQLSVKVPGTNISLRHWLTR